MKEGFKMERVEIEFNATMFSENERRILSDINLSPEALVELLSETPFAEGSHAVLFELKTHERNLVAKVGKGDKTNLNRGAKENVVLRLLRIQGFKEAPKVHRYMAPSNILFEERIEGKPIDDFDEQAISDLSEVLARLHSIKLEAYGKPLEKREQGTRMDCLRDGIITLGNLASAHEGDPDIIREVKVLLEKTRLEAEQVSEAFSKNIFTLIHFDLNPNNILRLDKDSGLVLIDWEQASVGDNAMDIAKLFLKCGFNPQQRAMFLEKYELLLLEKDPDFKQRLHVYEPLVLVNSVLWRLRVLSSHQEASAKDKEFLERVRTGLKKDISNIEEFIKESV